jgi:non-ribosomal peptide synthetase component F
VNLLKKVRESILEAFRNQEVQFDDLVRILQLPRDASYNPIFQTMFAYQNYPIPAMGNKEITFKPEWIGRGATQFDFSFFLWEEGNEILGVIEYSTELFTHSTISHMATHYISLLSAICDKPELQAGAYSILTTEEEQTILSMWNATEQQYPENLCIHDLIIRQTQKTPQTIAVHAINKSLTYKELDKKSNSLAHHLQSQGVKAETPVGLFLERNTDMVVALLAVLKAGGMYIPLDPYYPAERVALMIEDASIDIVITETTI